MKTLFAVAALITLCALLEVPQDYEWTPGAGLALRSEYAVQGPVNAVYPEAGRMAEDGGLAL
jgi:hypothetical protein